MKKSNINLRKASTAKKDDFYTQLSDIERELKNYKKHFKNKVVFCNCDDPRISNFFHYFSHNFEHLGLKKLITTCYKNQNADLFSQNKSEKAIYLEYTGDKNQNRIPDPDEIGIKHLKGDGDFRSEECIKLLKQSDIVVTNPPFSLFREYVAQLEKYKKKFLIIGSFNTIGYKSIFKLISNNKFWLGYGFNGGNALFETPYKVVVKKTEKKIYLRNPETKEIKEFARGVYDEETGLVKFGNVTWFTNLDVSKRHEDLILYKKYNPKEYPKFDHYDAINVNKTNDIPIDYKRAMGVPLTFLNKYNPEQFEIIDGLNRYSILNGPTEKTKGKYLSQVNGKAIYIRIVIRNKKV